MQPLEAEALTQQEEDSCVGSCRGLYEAESQLS